VDTTLTTATGPDYGYWDVFYTRGNAASGYRWVNLSSNYSGTPETTVTCKQLYDPNVNETTSGCDDASFSYRVDEGWPDSCKLCGGFKLLSQACKWDGEPSVFFFLLFFFCFFPSAFAFSLSSISRSFSIRSWLSSTLLDAPSGQSSLIQYPEYRAKGEIGSRWGFELTVPVLFRDHFIADCTARRLWSYSDHHWEEPD
jgi:hypothetical protein